jgi:hypothetical protein
MIHQNIFPEVSFAFKASFPAKDQKNKAKNAKISKV